MTKSIHSSKQIFTENLICVKHCSRCWKCYSEQNRHETPAVMELTFWLDMLTVTNYNFKKLTNMEVFNNKGIWQKWIHFQVYYATQTWFLPLQCGNAELSLQKPIQNFLKVSIYLNWPLELKQKYNCEEDLSRHNNQS